MGEGEVQFPEYERREAIMRTRTSKVRKQVIEYVCEGHGEPNIILLSGYGMDLVSWGKIYTELQGKNRVLAYNRFNVGGSSRSKRQHTGNEIVSLLRRLLVMAEMQPPYVVVGHSIGGVYAQLFARLYPKEVAGVVLVESIYPNQADIQRYCKRRWFDTLCYPLRSREIDCFDETSQQTLDAPAFPDVPLVVVSSGSNTSELFQEEQRSLASMSPRGTQVISERSGHFVIIDEPDVVIQAIRDVLAFGTERSFRSYGPSDKKYI